MNLASDKNEKQVIQSVADPTGPLSYLQPYLLTESRTSGKQIYTTDTYHEPDCLRFCPSNSSDKIEISLSGFTVLAKTSSQTARTNKAFSEGVHYWEIICPISCSSLQIGVSNKNQKEEVVQQFRTTTPRVIGIELNLDKLTMNFWLNGRYIKERAKKVPANQQWYPTVKFKEQDYFVIINPFAQGKSYQSDELNNNYLPLSLRSNEIQLYNSYITTRLSGILMIYGLSQEQKEDKAEIEKDLRKILRLDVDQELSDSVELIYEEEAATTEEKKLITMSLLKFKNHQDSLKYYHNNRDFKIFYDKQMATLIQMKNSKEKIGDIPQDLDEKLLKLLLSKVFIQDDAKLDFLVNSGLSNNLTIQSIAKKLTQLKDSLFNNAIEQQQIKPKDQDESNAQYLQHSDKLLLINDSQLKLVSRTNGSFNLESNSQFSLYPQRPEDQIRLNFSHDDVNFLMTHMDWSQLKPETYDILLVFLESIQKDISSKNIQVSYNTAYVIVKSLLNIAINQYEHIETHLESLQEQEIINRASLKVAKDVKPAFNNEIDLPFIFGQISIIDAHQLLSILLGLEDQLWAMTQSDQVSSSLQTLWSNSSSTSSRLHTAYGRLSSLITFPTSSETPFDTLHLAELGLVNTEDKYGKLQFYQDFKVEVENIFEKGMSSSNNVNGDLRAALERQFSQNLMLKGFPSWNVKMQDTLNNMPPSVHENNLINQNRNQEKIQYVKAIKDSDFIMTGGKDGSINIWNTKLRLQQVGGHNFKSKLYNDGEIDPLLFPNQTIPEQEEKKVQSGDTKFIIKKLTDVKATTKAETKEEVAGEDILFSMFNEAEEAEDVDDEDLSDLEEEIDQDLVDYLYEYSDSITPVQKANKDKPKVIEEEKKEEVKEEPQIALPEIETPIIPSEEFLNSLIMMGFTVEVSKAALIQTKNESLSAAIDAVPEIQAALDKDKKPQTFQMKVISYQCEVCTYINPEGKGICEVCGSAAPHHAYIQVKNENDLLLEKELAQAQIQAQEDLITKAQQEEAQKLKNEQLKLQAEEEAKRSRDEMRRKTKEYYEQTQIVDYLFAQINGGRDTKPLLAGVILENKLNQTYEVELQRFGYSTKYLRHFVGNAGKFSCKVCDIPHKNLDQALEHMFEFHKALVEGLYPIFIGSQLSTSKWNIRTNRLQYLTMKSDQIARVIFSFESLDAICQVGTNITNDQSMYIIGVGKQIGQAHQSVIIQRIDYDNNDIKIVNLSEDSQIFKQVGLNNNVQSLYYCQTSDRLIVQTTDQVLNVFDIDREAKNLHLKRVETITLKADEKVMKIENGTIYVKVEDRKIRKYLIDVKKINEQKLYKDIKDHQSQTQQREALSESEVLQMQIDPRDVTIQDIRRYEKLMNGKTIKALSNAQSVQGETTGSQKTGYYTKHHWIVNKQNESIPFEMEFEHPTSLISLNIDLVFNCKDTRALLEKLKKQQALTSSQSPAESQDNYLIDTSTIINNSPSKKQDSNIMNLGLLSIHGQAHESHHQHQALNSDQDSSSTANYLPLVVNHHKGAAYNQSYQVCRIVTDNSLIFASNYPKPEFYLKHQHGHKMNIDKFTIRSSINSKCGAYPVGSGIIFIADNLKTFVQTLPFHKFTIQDYNDWKQQRLKDPSPLRPYEPVAYFEFENETSITIDIDFQRVCKYVMLKPTGFRKKPNQLNQNFNTVPLEIEFFGVIGSSFEDTNHSSGTDNEVISDVSLQALTSHYDLQLGVINDNKVLKNLNNIDIQTLQGLDIQISSVSLSKYVGDLKNIQLVGKTSLKITDSHLQLQDINGLSLSLKDTIDENIWELRGVSIQGIVADQDQNIQANSKPLFNQPLIPISYMRSCLLSPKFFNVVNRVLAQIISSESHPIQLRLTIIQFLNKIMKLDRDYTSLILQQINLAAFLKLNLFGGDNTGVQLTIEFLQNFQRDVNFCQDLYNILINQVEQLPENFISYNGYEALIGLLIWSIPINPEQTLTTLINTLYKKVCLQKVSGLQTSEYINFRSRHNFNTFPFDHISFKTSKSGQNQASLRKESIDQSHQIVPQDSSNKIILPVQQIRKLKYDLHHIYEITFDTETTVTDIKVFLGNQEQIQYKMIVKILGENGQVIFYNTYDEQIFAQFASMAYQKSQTSNPSDDALHITGIEYKGKSLKLIIEFGYSNSSLPKSVKTKPPDSIIEVYGSYPDMALNQNRIKDMIDKKAQEFWQNSAKLVKVGKSMQMLQIAKSVEEFLIVPQVSSISTFMPQKDNEVSQQNQLETKNQIQIQHLAATKTVELDFLQEELKGKIRANDSNIKEIVDKIQAILVQQTNVIQDYTSIVPSLEYYMTITSDFTKIIRSLVKVKVLSKDKQESCFRSVDTDLNLSNVCFELFKRYVVYDSGQVRSDIQNFILQCLYPIMTPEEIRSFSFKVIDEFLSQSHSTFSQKAVLESLTTLGIPEGELVSFLIQKLSINPSSDIKNHNAQIQKTQQQLQPFVFMSSVLILVLNQLKQIRIPQPGQAFHKGVGCSGCKAKLILGWRYKCGHCPQDLNFDEQCMEKHLIEYPDHVMLVIKEQLPPLNKNIYNTKASKSKLHEPILPVMQFKEITEPLTHENQACENCGAKPINGYLYKCVNCEEYNLCNTCYNSNKLQHFSNHIFAELRKPLLEVDKNPTTIVQVLDSRFYPQTFKSHYEESPTKKEKIKQIVQVDQDDDDDFEDLAPLSISRSLSSPMPLKKQQQEKSASVKEAKLGQQYEKLDYDQQFIVLFHTCVWISQDIQKSFTKEEKIVLLKLTIDTMLQLIKLTHIKHIQNVISNKDAFFQILVSILQLNSKDLIQLFKNLFDLIRQPPNLIKSLGEDSINQTPEKKQQLQNDQKQLKSLLEILISHLQNFLKWLIDLGLQPDMAKLQSQQSHESWGMLLKSYQNQKVWLDHLQFIVDLFIKSTDELKQNARQVKLENSKVGNSLEKIPEDLDEAEEDDLVPLSMARSISVPLKKQHIYQQQQTQSISLQIIKNLVQLLYINEQSVVQIQASSPMKGQAKQPISHFKETESQTKYLSQMWSLVLKSLTSVSINQLIEARIFDSLVNAFLISTEEIKQITFPQILAITETIARQSVNNNEISKFICNLLFITLENVTGNHHEKVGYSICQGWLDILITSTVARQGNYEQTKTVFAKMNNEEMSSFLRRSTVYLNQYLNKGSFEGVTGANIEVMMRLNLASDLIYVIRYAESKDQSGKLAIQELFRSVSTNAKLRKEYQDSFNHLLTWLFLNARQLSDDTSLSQLGNSSSLTPATAKVKQITEHIEEIFQLLGDNGDQSEQAVKIALTSLTQIVRKMNKTLIDLSQSNSIGFELSVKLSERTNEYFIKLLSHWLVNDAVASYFVFDLGGFEFLLDTIGVGSEGESNMQRLGETNMEFELIEHIEGEVNQIQQNQIVSSKQDFVVSQFGSQNVFSSLQGSDLAQYLETNLQEFQQQTKAPQVDQIDQQEPVVTVYDKANQLFVQEFSKSIAMISSNGADPVQSFQKTDWSVNKRAYKHRVIVKHLTGNLRSEYWILFSLPHEVEIREIQIAFNNYWGADTEVYAEPLSVLVEAGMDENNLSLVCNLQIVKDDAFGSVSATVFGQNLLTFQQSQADFSFTQIQDIISQKLQSLQNFKVKYIKFCMRRHILTCVENSPLSTKFTKQPAFGINYISLLGYDLTKVGEYVTYIKQEQKRTALEVLSVICSGDFANILKVIANQPQTIEKMKKSFTLLASLVSIKQNLIEPTFIAISTYNNEMGDWIINQFLKSGRIYKHAALVGQIVICNKTELPRRLKFLQDHVMSSLRSVVKEERSTHGTKIKKLIPFIQIFIETLRIAAPDLENHNQAPIDIGIKESYLTDIVNLLNAATLERESQTRILTQLLILLLCPPAPFFNSHIDIYEFAVKNLIEDSGSMNNGDSNELQQQKENLVSILCATKTQIAQEILKRGVKLDKLLNPGKGVNTEDDKTQNLSFQHCIKFWINVAHDSEVRKILANDMIPIKLYQNLRFEYAGYDHKIVRKDSVIGEQELSLMVELIKQLTAGIPKLEGELAASLMQDLHSLSKIRDMNFVNKVFLQLLRIEKTVPICLWPYDSENKKWIPSYKPLTALESKNSQLQNTSHNNFVPSQSLQGEKRSVFIKNFKDIVGQHSKANVKKLLSSNWTLAHSQTEQGQVSQFQGFWKNIENKAPVVILISGTTSTGSTITYGCFSSKGIPAMPTNLAQDSDYPVTASPEDFVFCYIDNNSFHHFTPKQSVPIISMFTDYEGGGAISVANDFMLMSFSYDFVFTVGIVYDIEKVQAENNPKPEKEIENSGVNFLKFEIWTTDVTKTAPIGGLNQVGTSSVILPPPIIQPSKISQKPGDSGEVQVQSILAHDIKHAWYNNLNPYQNYRTNPVFMVPSHLTLQQLSKIMLQSNVSFKTRVCQNLVAEQDQTLWDLYQVIIQNQKYYEQNNGILDLEYEINQLLNIQSSAAEEIKEEDLVTELDTNTQVMSGYVPKMGLFEEFEDKGGVKLIISVTLQSLKLWKSEEQAKSWELWLKELESFSEIPLFFQLFLKNSKCKDLLFKVLAGQPDQEINATGAKADASAKTKWEEEQKSAVQFNYKILSETFQISDDLKLREIGIKCGLLPTILERLGAISGEKPRVFEEHTEEMKTEEIKQELDQQQQLTQQEKNVERKKRKGVGYSSKVGQTFNVTQYLENKKLRNDQIKNLVDICSNFINCKGWKAGEEVLDIIFESALLPLLESSFRNGSWLDMAKEYEVYHSYLALTRAIATQENLLKCLVKIDSRYKPSQSDAIYQLLGKLNDLAEIFINCLNQQQKSEQTKQKNQQQQEEEKANLTLKSQPFYPSQQQKTGFIQAYQSPLNYYNEYMPGLQQLQQYPQQIQNCISQYLPTSSQTYNKPVQQPINYNTEELLGSSYMNQPEEYPMCQTYDKIFQEKQLQIESTPLWKNIQTTYTQGNDEMFLPPYNIDQTSQQQQVSELNNKPSSFGQLNKLNSNAKPFQPSNKMKTESPSFIPSKTLIESPVLMKKMIQTVQYLNTQSVPFSPSKFKLNNAPIPDLIIAKKYLEPNEEIKEDQQLDHMQSVTSLADAIKSQLQTYKSPTMKPIQDQNGQLQSYKFGYNKSNFVSLDKNNDDESEDDSDDLTEEPSNILMIPLPNFTDEQLDIKYKDSIFNYINKPVTQEKQLLNKSDQKTKFQKITQQLNKIQKLASGIADKQASKDNSEKSSDSYETLSEHSVKESGNSNQSSKESQSEDQSSFSDDSEFIQSDNQDSNSNDKNKKQNESLQDYNQKLMKLCAKVEKINKLNTIKKSPHFKKLKASAQYKKQKKPVYQKLMLYKEDDESNSYGEDSDSDSDNESPQEYESENEIKIKNHSSSAQKLKAPKKFQLQNNHITSSSDQGYEDDKDSEDQDPSHSYDDEDASELQAPNENEQESSESDSEQNVIPDSGDSSYQLSVHKSIEKELPETVQIDSEIPESLAREVIRTYKIVYQAVAKLLKYQKVENFIENALNLPLAECYKALLQDLRFDYMEMKDPNDTTGVNYKHHYNTIASQNQNPPSSKMVRLAQELADLSNALPYENTNAIFVRVDSQRVDLMKALICGASNTPYAHGCYEYDIFCDNNYPREPPKMNLITTGNGSVRFNPNLYACGKVCLSLLGTWRGSATENWDPKLSTILQVLLSTQAIIMSEEVYFNEPGFENEAGTPEGEKKNEGYQNIVRYCNIKFAMIEQIKKPAKGFESAIKRHFYIKKSEILKEVHQWVEYAEKNEATYGGLVNDHNYNWANQFKATKTKYKEMLVAAVQILEEELNKLERPTDYELKLQSDLRKRHQHTMKKKKRQGIAEGKEDLDMINVDYEEDNELTQINTDSKKEIDVTDEAVKDRWSRYIGAMGVEAVAKQAAANIFLSGAGALGIEIAKNLVLSGCKSFTLHDYKAISMRDLSGQFFLNLEEDILNEKKKKNSRGEACMPRLKQLNYYVKCQLAPVKPIPLSEEEIEQEPWNLHMMNVIILTEATYDEIIFINEYCRKKGKKFICADAYGVFTRVFNDFGDAFEVLDQNGEDLQDVMIKSISNEEEGLVELLPITKHKFQDGDEVVFSGVQGMKLLPGEKHDDVAFTSDSINETIHKVKVITPYAFRIGNTLKFEKYEHNGIAKQLKTKKTLSFKSFKDCMLQGCEQMPLDGNLAVADFEKMQNSQLAHIAFEALDVYKKEKKQSPGSWNKQDADEFLKLVCDISKRYDLKPEDWKPDSYELKFFYLFSFTNQGVFNPLCAFQGGFIAQECMKAITQKFTPTNQVFYYDALEVLPTFDPSKDFKGEDKDPKYFDDKYVNEIIKTQEINHRSDGLRILLGADMIEKLAYTRLFMVGAGAIGCELLKNYAMLGVGVGKPNHAKKLQGGSIVLTDPDVIEVSNLNRQFLFREKHLRNPKSSTAAAAAIYMNRELKENIIARLDKVHEGTSHIYTDQFFEELSVVTNALDNVHARIYIDARCVTAKTPLLESGTLGPKGHVQVVLPFLTESYGSQNDPEDSTEIPHCTLKMFPEETLHCVEWARDKFGKIFTQGPQNTIKILEEGESFQPVSQQDTISLKEGLKIIEKRPKNFEDCIQYARMKFEKFFNHDIRQLLHVYPLDAKTKDGNMFWSLPKRAPVPIDFDATNQLHYLYVSSFACLRANTFKIEIPSKAPRSEEFRKEIGLLASKIKVPAFVPNDEKAKEIQASVQKQAKDEEEKKEGLEESKQEEDKIDPNDMEALMKRFHSLLTSLPTKDGKILSEDLLHPEIFEKDNDANYHIDFIYAMANCRSTNYKLDLMDWLTVKLKAGRIVPALSTTTSAVAGLQTLELVKLMKQCKMSDHRNTFLNLAIPIMQASEPGEVMKTKLTENIEVTLWSRWDVKKGKDVKLQEVIDYLQQTYPGLEVRDVLKGSAPLYFHAIMNAPGKEADKQKALESKVADLVGADSDDKYVDITVTCIKTGDENEQILSGVPPVRVYFE